jgi:hypothetical protein
MRALDEAGSFGEVLESLAQHAGREAGRAVVFLVKGDRLKDWRTVGFAVAADEGLDLELGESGLLGKAVRAGHGVRWYRDADDRLPDFARDDEEPRDAAAWPISVGGSVVALLYADGPAADTSDRPWPACLEVLARHAGRVLEGITIRQAAGLMSVRAKTVGRRSSGSIQ